MIQANAYREKRYLAEYNRLYTHAAPADYHWPRPTSQQLDEPFWLEEERVSELLYSPNRTLFRSSTKTKAGDISIAIWEDE